MNFDLAAAGSDHPVVSAALALLLLLFVAGFVGRGVALLWALGRALGRLRALPAEGDPALAERCFGRAGGLAAHWDDYRKTLYRAGAAPAAAGRGEGAAPTVRWLASVPAESVWNGPAVVDPRVGAEFFKHLPGVFTGVGILGTFFGLVRGLQQFRVSADAQEVRVSLEALMGAVGGAFTVSAVAIGLAMAATLVEKLLLAALNARTARIALALDRRFGAEPAEAFLEASARHTAATAQRLTGLVDAAARQRAATEAQTERLEAAVAGAVAQLTDASRVDAMAGSLAAAVERGVERAIERTFEPAMERSIEPAVERGMGRALERAVERALGPAVERAIERAIEGAIERSMARAVDAAIDRTLERLEAAGVWANAAHDGERAARERALQHETAQAQQQAIAQALRTLHARLDTLPQALADEARQGAAVAGAQLGESLAALSRQLSASVGQSVGLALSQASGLLAERETAARARDDARLDAQASRSDEQLGRLVASVEALLRQSALADDRLQQAVAALSATSRSAIGGLGDGAQQVQAASRQFAAAADKAGTAMAQAADWGERLDATGRQVAAAAQFLQQGVADYQGHRDAVGRMVGELQTLLGQARREASLSGEVLQRLEAASRALGRSQQQAETFLGGVAEVLGGAHEAFAQAMLRTVGQQNEAFQQQLATAVGRLARTVEQLDDALGLAAPPPAPGAGTANGAEASARADGAEAA